MRLEDVKNIMLIDDNPTDRFIHNKLLTIYKIGTDISEYPSGRSALDFFKENKTNADALPDVILLDVLMPEMSGFDFLIHLETLEEELIKKPLVFMLSSTDDEGDIRKARTIPLVKRMLRKPFSPEALLKAISEF